MRIQSKTKASFLLVAVLILALMSIGNLTSGCFCEGLWQGVAALIGGLGIEWSHFKDNWAQEDPDEHLRNNWLDE